MPTIQELIDRTDRHIVVFREVEEILIVGNGNHHPWINLARKRLEDIHASLAAKRIALEDMGEDPNNGEAKRQLMSAYSTFSTSSRSLEDQLTELVKRNTLGLPDPHISLARSMLEKIKTMQET